MADGPISPSHVFELPGFEKIMTVSGFEKVSELEPGNFVFSEDGNLSEVLSAAGIRKREAFFVSLSGKASVHICRDSGPREKTIKTAEPLQFPKRNLAISPYLAGCLLGDGTMIPGTSVQITTSDAELIEKLNRSHMPGGWRFEKSGSSKFAWRAKATRQEKRGKGIKSSLRVLLEKAGLFGMRCSEKSVPEDFLMSSEEDRRELLKGLMDTDGSAYKWHSVFGSTSFKLAEQVAFLTRSLGGQASIWDVNPPKGMFLREPRPQKIVKAVFPPGTSPFKLSRKRMKVTRENECFFRIEKEESIGKHECVKIETRSKSILVGESMIPLRS